jgi:hypothetical protein
MNQTDRPLELYRGEKLLGTLSQIEELDSPWYKCHFQPTPEFEQYRVLFNKEIRVFQREGMSDSWVKAYEKIDNLLLTLVDPQVSKTTDIFMLHFEAQHVRFKAYFEPDK